jgi:restriction system protein
MSIPDFQSLMLPLLEVIGDGAEHSNRKVATVIAKKYALTDEDLHQMLPSGQNRVFTNRLAWAKAYLKKAGLLESPSRGSLRITPKGKEVLAKPPSKINIQYLKSFPSFNWHGPPKSTDQPDEPSEADGRTPEELLESSYATLKEKLADELLERVRVGSPQFFERLVVDLLVAMGYGGSRADAGQAVGRAGDGGIDGIIKEDKLGLDVVCIQAKRWQATVGSPEVQKFAGSMEGFKARKGVLITTSSFSKDANDYVKKIERKIVLIDGIRLAELMIDHGIGVETAHTYVVNKLDQDYFVEEEV